MRNKTKKTEVLVVGELNVDLILAGLHELPPWGKEIIAPQMSLTLGSSSAIFAGNLSVLGTGASFIGRIGRDQFGETVLDSLSGRGVDTRGIIVSDTAKTGLTVAFTHLNERAMVTYPGAMLELSEKEVDDTVLRSHRHLHVSSLFLQPALKEGIVSLFRRAKQYRLTTSLDTQWDPEERWDCDWKGLLPLVDVFLPNAEELKHITGQPDTESGIHTLKEYANIIVVKEGTEGATGYEKGAIYRQPAFLNRQVKDAIGAGDSFDAGFIHKFLQRRPLKDCLEFGALCGAVNTTEYGGTTAFSDPETIKQTALEQFNYAIDDL